jgi:hypothetical protein
LEENKMAYCRCRDDSDVYVWCGWRYEVNFCEGKDGITEKLLEHNLHSTSFETPEETLDYLLKIRKLGFKVPERSTERLKYEIGLPNKYLELIGAGE